MSGGKAPKTGTNWMDVQMAQEQRAAEQDKWNQSQWALQQQQASDTQTRNKQVQGGMQSLRNYAQGYASDRGLDYGSTRRGSKTSSVGSMRRLGTQTRVRCTAVRHRADR